MCLILVEIYIFFFFAFFLLLISSIGFRISCVGGIGRHICTRNIEEIKKRGWLLLTRLVIRDFEFIS